MMTSKALIVAVVLTFSLSGCTTFQRLTGAQTPVWPWTESGIIGACPNSNQSLECTDLDALNTYVKAMEFCRAVHNFYENGGAVAKSAKFGVGVLGTLSGAVLAPVTTGSASTAFASLSGATNGVQTSLEESFSSSFNLSKQIAVADEGRNGMNEYNSAKTAALSNNEKVGLAIGIAYKCSVAANKTDSAVIAALSNDKAILDDQKKKQETLQKDLDEQKKAYADKLLDLEKMHSSLKERLDALPPKVE